MASTRGYTDFQPSIEWTEDPKNYILHINLPDFRKDEFRVQVDGSGKLTVRGGKTLGDGRYLRLEQVFDVPKDSYIGKISGKFDQGRLSLFMPKKVVTETEKPVAEGKKEEAPIQKDQPKSNERKEEESIQKEKPKGGEETKEPSSVYKEKPLTEEAPIQKEKPKGEKETKTEAAPVYEEKPLEKKEEQPIQDEPISKQKPKKEEHPDQVEPIQKRKPWSGTVSEGFEKCKKKGMAWKERIEEGWLDHGPMDGLMESISKNKKIIALAAAAFAAGFYASQKLRSSRR